MTDSADESAPPAPINEPTPDAPATLAQPTATFPPNLEVQSPIERATVQADFIFVTPTAPPSKTPTTTPTVTPTLTLTPTATLTATATATRQLFPTSVIIPVDAPVAAPVDRICDTQWFFIEPRPADCPLSPPTASQGVYQEFENGYMIWFGALQLIYVMYNDATFPRWQAFRDHFTEDMPHFSEEYLNAPRAGLWQPRRGFGLLWRSDSAVRNRIGWATMEWEMPYSLNAQQSADGSLFLNAPDGHVFGLFSATSQWQRYAGRGN
ncbi:MAG: hypothetical protein EA396_11680 [Anaerolineaceae bacterium]|nr:MAG: hypothetical protein EA396_11680 [Anaerolineaceae bacterium]